MVPFLAVLCAPPRSECSHSAGAGFIRNCLHQCTVAAIHGPLRSPLPRSISRGRPILHEQKIIGFAPIYDCHAQTVAADGDRTFDLSLEAREGPIGPARMYL